MRRKYAAIVLGLTLAIGSMNVFAAEESTSPDTEMTDTMEDSKAEETKAARKAKEEAINIDINLNEADSESGTGGEENRKENMEEISLEDIQKGDIVEITLDENGDASMIEILTSAPEAEDGENTEGTENTAASEELSEEDTEVGE